MKRTLFLAAALLLLPAWAWAQTPSIADGSTAVATLADGSTVKLHFRAGPNGMFRVLAAVGRDDLREWDLLPVQGDKLPTPAAKPAPEKTPFRSTVLTLAADDEPADKMAIVPVQYQYQPAPPTPIAPPASAKSPSKPVATAAATSLVIVPPAGDLLPGEDYDLAVSGLSLSDLTPGRICFVAPESSACKARLVAQWGLAGLEPVVTFRAKAAGSYRVLIVKALPAEQLQVAASVVVVKGAPPPPNPPDPGPGPSPHPPAKPRCLIIEEQSQRTAAQAVVLSSPKVRTAFSGGFVVEDKDVKDSKGQTPAKLQPYIDTAVKAGLPYLFIFDDAGKLWKEGKLPATVDDTLGLLKGGK